ncbi:collagen alpha-2(V) chain-like [Amphibalanus amphitrite]|uniref:collagen alpha-2(V) chain-like n=1 Tax=Amphibalanus amphitrite TaxID=1232801 RepID=UPI001C9061DE|nr:collagen alpha-2(V) chain-like [Amphibalanus amphitrite]
MSRPRSGSGSPEQSTPVCRCRVLYLGSAVPHASKDGLQGIQGPLSQLYPAEGLAAARGIDSRLTVWSNGLLLENVDEQQHKVTRFFPISSLHYCAAVRYVLLPTPSGQPVARFLPLDSPPGRFPNPAHPPLFAAILRRTTGLKVLECHVFMCRRETPANALVSSCFHVYADAEQARRLNGQMYEAICGVKGGDTAPAPAADWSEEEAKLDLDERADDTGENGEHAENGETGVELGAESDEEPPAGRPGSREQLRIDVGDGEGGPAGRPGWTEAATDPGVPLYATARRNRPRQRQMPAAPPPPPSPPPPPPSGGRPLPPGPDWDEPDRTGRSVSGSPGAWRDRAAMGSSWEDRGSSAERVIRTSSRRRNLGPPPPPPQRHSMAAPPGGFGPMSSLSLPRPSRVGPRSGGEEQVPYGPYGAPPEPPGYATVGRPQYATLGNLRSRKTSPPGPPIPPGPHGHPLMAGGMPMAHGMPGPGLRRLQPHEQRAFGFSLEQEQRSRSHGNLLSAEPGPWDAGRAGHQLHRQMADMDLKERKEPRPRRSIFASLRRS